MQFLVPLYLLGALAVAVPIYLHLRRKPPRDSVAFSSLMFLQPTPHPPVKRSRKLDQIPLLLLRCLALLLLAAFFARPFLRGGDKELTPGEGRTVILIDTSASMKRTGVWDDAVKEARKVIDDLKPTDSLAIMAMDGTTRTVVSFDDWADAATSQRKAIATGAVESLEPGWLGTDLGSGLLAAAELLADAKEGEEVTGAGRIVVVSDLQGGATIAEASEANWPAGIVVDLHPVDARAETNATLAVAPSPDASRTMVRVWNDGNSTQEQFTLAAGDDTLNVVVPAGESRVVEIPGATEVVTLTGDKQAFDNQLFLAPLQPAPLTLQFIGHGSPDDSNRPEYYFRRAFAASAFLEPRFVESTAENPSIVAVARAVEGQELDAMRGHLETGGRILLAVTDAGMASTLGALAGADDTPAMEESRGRYALLQDIDFDHPLLRGFQDPRWRDFTSVHFWKHRVLDLKGLPDAEVLARFDNGDPAWVHLPVGRGSLVVMLAGWHPDDSQLALSSKFLPLLYSIFADRDPRVGEARQFFVGDPLPIESSDRTITLPDGKSLPLADEDSYLPEAPGVYTVAGDVLTRRFAVNLRRSESELQPLGKASLEALGVPLARTPTQSGRSTEPGTRRLRDREAESDQHMWKWAAIILLTLLILESLVTARGRGATPIMEEARS